MMSMNQTKQKIHKAIVMVTIQSSQLTTLFLKILIMIIIQLRLPNSYQIKIQIITVLEMIHPYTFIMILTLREEKVSMTSCLLLIMIVCRMDLRGRLCHHQEEGYPQSKKQKLIWIHISSLELSKIQFMMMLQYKVGQMCRIYIKKQKIIMNWAII